MIFDKPCHSFTEWSEKGFRIKKGSKAKFRCPNGVPHFDESQVWFPFTSLVDVDGCDSWELDDLDDFLDPEYYH